MIFNLSEMTIGFVGDIQYHNVPLTTIDYLAYIVGGTLVVSICFVFCQISMKTGDEID